MLYVSPIFFSPVCLELLCPDGDPEAERHVIDPQTSETPIFVWVEATRTPRAHGATGDPRPRAQHPHT